MLGFPIKFAEAPCQVRSAAPALGADTDAVLEELGLSRDRIRELREQGTV
jgi:crotonobetainyl-CoA:carnitine CoA-transferase CaiB-like acyl-CoA transferase